MKKDWIEDLVVNKTMKIAMYDTIIEVIIAVLMELQEQEGVNLPLYEHQLKETEQSTQNLLNAVQQDMAAKSTKGRLEEPEVVKEELETKVTCEKLAEPKVSAEFDILVSPLPKFC